ncbi:unnamed protein product [Pedinophyceae sp. YPF-701]|nr:unnamed protein product [Pedinophyceae sp. YPF-701]
MSSSSLLSLPLITLVSVFTPPLFMLMGAVSTAQFGVLFRAIVYAARSAEFPRFLSPLKPGLEQLATFMESSLGPAHRFSPNFTQCMLAAILICLLVKRP